MRAWWILLATGCWTAPARPAVEPAPTRVAPAGTCSIRERYDDEHQPMTKVELAVDGEVFARPAWVQSLELQIRTSTARAHAESWNAVLEGELDLRRFAVRPRERTPRDGWVVVKAGNVHDAPGAVARLVVELPAGLAPRTVDLDVPCNELTSLRLDDDVDSEGDSVRLAKGAHLHAARGGPRVSRVTEDALEAQAITRDGDMVRVAIDGGDASVLVWVAASAVTTPSTLSASGGWGTIGTGRYGTSTSVSCAHELAIYARSSRRGRVRVGHLKPGQSVQVKGAYTTADETGIDLSGDIAAFVLASDLAGCKP